MWQATSAPWPAPAVHDTVAAIARQAAYSRTLGTTLWRQLSDWLERMLGDFLDQFRGSSAGRVVTVILLVLLGALVVARFVVAWRSSREDAVAGDGFVRRGTTPDFWSEAERLAATGRFTEAAHALFAALLTSFAQRGEIRLHASKTAGDYARELARHRNPAQSSFQAFRRRYDRVIYGLGTCDADEYEALLRDARPLLSPSRAA